MGSVVTPEIKKICFYSHAAHGDMHFSRGFVKYIINKFGDRFVYYYWSYISSRMFLDIPQVTHPRLGHPHAFMNPYKHQPYLVHPDCIYINTWYEANPEIHAKLGFTHRTLMEGFYYTFLKLFDFEIKNSDIDTFLPDCDLSFYQTERIDEFLKRPDIVNKKKILLCNTNSVTLKDLNFDMNPVVEKLSIKHPNYVFFMTGVVNYKIKKPNVFYTKDIIQIDDNDIYENVYLGTKCNLILGRTSGVHCCCYIKQILFDPEKTILTFLHRPEMAYWSTTPSIKANIIWNPDQIRPEELMERTIEKLN